MTIRSGKLSRLARSMTLAMLRVFIAAGCIFILFELIVHLHPPALSWGIVLLGRSPACSARNAIAGVEQRYLLASATDRIDDDLALVDRDQDEDLEVWGGADGRYWIPSGNGKVLPQLIAQQVIDLYGDEEFGVRKGDVVLDCGAHVGLFVQKALDRGARLVVAIEPAPINLMCLRRNFQNEIDEGRVIVYPKGVWDKEDVLPFYESPANSAADSFVMEAEGDVVKHELPLTTIDQIKAELNLDRVDFVKMDIKGATERALRGAARTLSTDQPRLAISTEEWADQPQSILALIHELQPAYQSKCGACGVNPSWEVEPLVVFAW